MKPKTADQHNREVGVQSSNFVPGEKKQPREKIEGKILLPNDGWHRLSTPIPIQDFNDRRGRIVLLDDGKTYLIGDLSFAALSTMRVKVIAYTDALTSELYRIEKQQQRTGP